MSDEESEKLQTDCFILLYRNMTNENEIVGVERAIRNVGFRADLQYKPAIYTELGIYRNNKFGIRPTVYTSVRKNVDGESGFEVTNLAKEDWVYRYLLLKANLDNYYLYVCPFVRSLSQFFAKP